MRWHRYVGRLIVAVVSMTIVCGALVAMFAAMALAIDWDIPEPTELLGPSSLFDRNGVPLFRFAADVERRVVPLEDISPSLGNAVVATEDHRFYEHQGVDPFSVLRAVVSNVRSGGIREGGSTLTQQFVKNVYVGADRTFYRKVREALISLQLEKTQSKDEILEAYLNRVYFGDGAYGAEAAALSYFGKPAAELTLAESATLASVLTSPSRLSPRVAAVPARARRDRVLDQMAEHGLADPLDVAAAKEVPLEIAPRSGGQPYAPYYVEEIRRQLLIDPAFGPERLYNGGLIITAALDVEAQRRLDAEVLEDLAAMPDDPGYDAGVVVLDPRTGDVLASWSGRDFGREQVDLATGQGSAFGGRPSGSTFKPIVLATALENGMDLSTSYPAPGRVTINDWSPSGGGCGGRCTLEQAMISSINTVYAQVGRDVGTSAFTDMAKRLGVRTPLADNDLTQSLGTASVTPLDLSSAFGTFANDGVACPARHVLDVRDPEGVPLPAPDPRTPTPEEREAWATHLDELGYDFGEEDLGRCYRAIAPSVARSITRSLEGAVASGTGRNAIIDRPQAGKTGTTNDSKEVWFAGYTPQLSIAVSFYYVPRAISLAGLPGCRGACFGGGIPALLWRDIATALLVDVPPEPFTEPGDDERLLPDRRRLGTSGSGGDGSGSAPRPRATTAPAPSAEPTPEPTPEATAGPTQPPAAATEPPPPEDQGGGGGGGGILPPILPGGGGEVDGAGAERDPHTSPGGSADEPPQQGTDLGG
ncbi:penicillin-binding protein 1A [soil metagenome]